MPRKKNAVVEKSWSSKGKSAWLAAALNFFLSGLGYVYLGKRVTFGFILLAGEMLMLLWLFVNPLAIVALMDSVFMLAAVCWTIAFALDAYNLGRE